MEPGATAEGWDATGSAVPAGPAGRATPPDECPSGRVGHASPWPRLAVALLGVLGLLSGLGLLGARASHQAPSPWLAAPARSDSWPRTASGQAGILPPANPPANIPPNPDLLAICSPSGYDDSAACVDASVKAIDNARSQEGLPGIELPGNWYQLTPAEQLFVATNLERTVRGLPPMAGLTSALDQAAATGAAQGADPEPPAGYPASAWGSNWAGGLSNPLEVVYYWMYDDGPGSPNVACPNAGAPGCWGHRDNVLMEVSCQDCVMGAAFDSTGWQGGPSWAELLVETSGSDPTSFSWSAETRASTGPAVAPSATVAAAPDPGGSGLWTVSAAGAVSALGGAPNEGDMASDGFTGLTGPHPLAAPIVGIAPTPSGQGYWLVAQDGGVFTFGNAPYLGNTYTIGFTGLTGPHP
ncbi:hypothetical protein ACFFRE_05150, partial [Aciditerrimonas ferrireducens]